MIVNVTNAAAKNQNILLIHFQRDAEEILMRAVPQNDP